MLLYCTLSKSHLDFNLVWVILNEIIELKAELILSPSWESGKLLWRYYVLLFGSLGCGVFDKKGITGSSMIDNAASKGSLIESFLSCLIGPVFSTYFKVSL